MRWATSFRHANNDVPMQDGAARSSGLLARTVRGQYGHLRLGMRSVGISPSRLIHSPWAIANSRVLHSGAKALHALLRSPGTASWEFELRYRRYLAEFGESDDDILVSTYSKSGTTWMQMILYQLTTAGNMDFDHLFDISPWVYYSALREVAPVHTPQPRIIKSHDRYGRFTKGRRGRFIFVVRDGRDVCLSLFHHRRNFKRYDGSFEQHFDDFLNGTEYNWFDHLRPWLANSAGLPITYVRFEDLKQNFAATVLRVAEACGIAVTESTLSRVLERCSFEYMKQHEARFAPRNEHFAGRTDAPYLVRRPDQFIRHGRVGEGVAALTGRQLDAYRKRFERSLADFAVVADYR
jgi:hypothetical protein